MSRVPPVALAFLALATTARAQEAAAPAAGAPAAADESVICTDRPTKSNNACTVDPGKFQIETDLFNGTFQRFGGVTTDTYYVTNPTFKYGLVKGVDLEANIAPYEFVRTHDAFGDHTLGGISDLYLKVKYAAFSTKDGVTQFSLIPYVKAPTARLGVGNGAWEGGVSIPINIKLNDKLSLTFSPEFDAFKDSTGDGRHFNTSQTINLGYSLPQDWTVAAELWGDWNDDPAGTLKQYSLDFAVTKLVGKTFQLDAGVNLGLNHDTPGVQAYVGVSKRF